MGFKKSTNFRKKRQDTRTRDRQSEPHSGPRTTGSWSKPWKGLLQKAAGQSFLTRLALNVWKKEKSKRKQAKAAKGNNQYKQFF